MKPLYFELDYGFPVTILPGEPDERNKDTQVFQLYFGSPTTQEKSLNDLNNYFGLVSFDSVSQQFYYSPGSRLISSDEILQVIDCIKSKILNL